MLDSDFVLALHKERVATLRAEADEYRAAAAARRARRERGPARRWPWRRHDGGACRT